jgi:hypothetical protein
MGASALPKSLPKLPATPEQAARTEENR